MSTVPVQVRDGIISAVALLINRDFEAVASLFGELMLLPQSVLDNPEERRSFTQALQQAAEAVLSFGSEKERRTPEPELATAAVSLSLRDLARKGREAQVVPTLRFDRLLTSLLLLAPRFAFTLPPYFVNNARALGTLEGMARRVDPSFSVLREVYPFALRRILTNPTNSPRLEATLVTLTHDAETGRVRWQNLRRLLLDAARLLGIRQRSLLAEVLSSSAGRRFAARLVCEQIRDWGTDAGLWACRCLGMDMGVDVAAAPVLPSGIASPASRGGARLAT